MRFDNRGFDIRWFDNHCHLTTMRAKSSAEPADVVAAAAADGVSHLLTVGCTVDDAAEAAEIASCFDNVWATAGVHPHDAAGGIDGLEALFDDENIVAVGECGLDFHYDRSPRAVQADVFRAQIGIANERELPFVIHTREAWEETFDILDAEGIPSRTVFHCFTGGPDEAAESVARGAMLSFSGIVTFPSARDLQAAALATPLDRIMVETDSPFLAPVPHRGTSNQPANVAIVGAFIAELRGVAVDDVATATFTNACSFYGV